MTLLAYLKTTYGTNYPIILKRVAYKNCSYDTLRKMFSNYVKSGELKRFVPGVYYFPTQTILGESALPYELFIKEKFLQIDDEIVGYYSGRTLINQYGLSTQVPNVREITTNLESNKLRKINIRGRNLITRRPLIEITTQNVNYLEYLDLFRYLNKHEIYDNKKILVEIAFKKDLEKTKIDKLIEQYPKKVEKLLKESGIYNEITWKWRTF